MGVTQEYSVEVMDAGQEEMIVMSGGSNMCFTFLVLEPKLWILNGIFGRSLSQRCCNLQYVLGNIYVVLPLE